MSKQHRWLPKLLRFVAAVALLPGLGALFGALSSSSSKAGQLAGLEPGIVVAAAISGFLTLQAFAVALDALLDIRAAVLRASPPPEEDDQQ